MTAVNGIASKTIIDSLLSVSRSDGLHGQAKKLDNINIEPLDIDTANYSFFDTYFPLFFPGNFNTDRYALKIRHYMGNSFNATVSSLSKRQRAALYTQRIGIIAIHEKSWTLNYLNNKTVCLKLGNFDTWEWKGDYRKYLDSVFILLKRQNIANLVVDIRGNEGGDDGARDEVLSYLVNKPFGCDNPMRRLYRFLSIPDTLLPYLTTWDKSFKKPKDPADYSRTTDGLFEPKQTNNIPCKPIVPKANVFKGRKFLLTDAKNSSTSFTLADIFQREQVGEIIGKPTGGNKQGLNGGQFFFLNLPISKFEIDIPLVWAVPALARADDGVTPDCLIKTKQADIYYKRDAQLNYIRKLIR